MDTPRRIVAGNWKMNGVAAALHEAHAVAESLTGAPASCRVVIFPPATLIHRLTVRIGEEGPVEVGAQDCHCEAKGAYTGDASAEMLHDAGARLVLLGHSERRAAYGEGDALIACKVAAALRGGLEPMVCVGESLEQRRSGTALDVVAAQVDGSLPDTLDGGVFSVAYEPVWAIGTGLTPTLEQIAEVHACIRERLRTRFDHAATIPVLYGGSVNPANAADILGIDSVDGALVGGASLKAEQFMPIVRAG